MRRGKVPIWRSKPVLSAAYDYYPFGMLMPDRYVHAPAGNCIPITRYRKSNGIVSTTDLLMTYDPNDPNSPKWTNSAWTTNVMYPTQPGGYQATLTSNEGITTLDGSMTFRAQPTGATGLTVEVTMTENNFPSVTGSARSLIGPGNLIVELRNLASGGIGTFLTNAYMTGSGKVSMTVPAGMVQPGDYIRLWQHYDMPVLPSSFPTTTPVVAQITYNHIVATATKPAVDEQYIVMSCDTDGMNNSEYRFGFNGQQKDNEYAGEGNHNTALYWEYDTRLGRRWNLDPVEQIQMSDYVVNRNNPIQINDPNGDQCCQTADALMRAKLELELNEEHLGPLDPEAFVGTEIVMDAAIGAAFLWDLVSGQFSVPAIKRTQPAGTPAAARNAAPPQAKAVLQKANAKQVEAKTKVAKAPTSNAARREAMRKKGIPTSQQPERQRKNKSGREYDYKTPKEGGGSKEQSVQQRTLDRSHEEEPHWEAGDIRTDEWGNPRYNQHGSPKMENIGKTKVEY